MNIIRLNLDNKDNINEAIEYVLNKKIELINKMGIEDFIIEFEFKGFKTEVRNNTTEKDIRREWYKNYRDNSIKGYLKDFKSVRYFAYIEVINKNRIIERGFFNIETEYRSDNRYVFLKFDMNDIDYFENKDILLQKINEWKEKERFEILNINIYKKIHMENINIEEIYE